MNDMPLKGWSRLRDLVQSVLSPAGRAIGAEIGVSQGWTSEHLLREFPGLSLLMVDFWDSSSPDSGYRQSGDSMARLSENEQAAKMRHATERTMFAAERRRIIKSDSVEAAKAVPDGWLDFAFIDASHLYENVLGDARALTPKVQRGGLLIFHDFRHPRDKRGLWGVERACREVCEACGLELHGDEKATICWAQVTR